MTLPTYGYQCTRCRHEFSVFQSMKDAPVATCPECSGDVKRLLYPVGVVFKGSGWHINDYRKPEKSADSDGAKTDEAKAGDSKPAEAKGDSTSTASGEGKKETADTK